MLTSISRTGFSGMSDLLVYWHLTYSRSLPVGYCIILPRKHDMIARQDNPSQESLCTMHQTPQSYRRPDEVRRDTLSAKFRIIDYSISPPLVDGHLRLIVPYPIRPSAKYLSTTCHKSARCHSWIQATAVDIVLSMQRTSQ